MVLGIRYLTGYAVATNLARQKAEWPPHPARVFMAMAAAHFETGADPKERTALEWLEKEPAPKFFASGFSARTLVETYVPVNDQRGAVIGRTRQSRSFPGVRLDHDSVYLFWNGEPEVALHDAISGLCEKVTRIGHSSSLTQMWLLDSAVAIEPNWVPEEQNAKERLRVTEKGFLAYLERSFNSAAIEEYFRLTDERDAAKGRAKTALKEKVMERFGDSVPEATRPVVTSWRGYRCVDSEKPAPGKPEAFGPFDSDFIVLSKSEGAALGLETTLQLTAALRNAAMKAAKEAPEWLSGHAEDGSPSKHPHAAFFPLPYVGFEHADGHVMGLGITLPRELHGISLSERTEALRKHIGPMLFDPESGAARTIQLWKDNVWCWTLDRETRERPPVALQRATWVGPSDRWASVTPVVLHHYPKKGRIDDVERIVREAFQSALLPQPETVWISSVSAHAGAGLAKAMPSLDNGDGLTNYQTHVEVTFKQNVGGPMLVGRGRFRGYGLFRPLRGQARTE